MKYSTLARRCAVVVPCFNEAQRLQVQTFVDFLKETPSGFHLIFVDDGSRDNTLESLGQIKVGAGESAFVLARSPNGGKAEAVRFGMNYALDNLDPDVVGFWDADLATPLEAIGDLLSEMEESEAIQMVFGARIKLLGRHVERKLERHYLGRVFATVVSNVLDLAVYDTQCGAKLFRATPDLREVLREPFISRWIFDVEIIARFIRLRGVAWVHEAIYEYPLKRWEDVAGSKVKAGDFVKAAGEIVAIYQRYLRKSG
ncbi:MAG: glycosyltransferase [Bryobacteraceae bacterium]|nr:glycosyltransferase [Bryobacteraceae bacterium]